MHLSDFLSVFFDIALKFNLRKMSRESCKCQHVCIKTFLSQEKGESYSLLTDSVETAEEQLHEIFDALN
jgi:hypothetical protein